MKLNGINIRDPFILVHDDKYYMYGSRADEAWGKCTGLDVYISDDLYEWSDPIEAFSKPDNFWSDMNYWAPEVYKYNDRFYMLASFKSQEQCRGTQILVSDKPTGPFVVHSEEPITPRDWECLDGTLYIAKNGNPYMVFCHEWLQTKDGEMFAIEMSKDLSCAVEEPFLLFKASEPLWAPKTNETFVTDGPFTHRLSTGKLLMIWSSFLNDKYVEAIAYSDNEEIDGKWIHEKELLFSADGGHGMIFTSIKGELMFIMHSPNKSLEEHPVIKRIYEENDTIYAK